jgi:DNA-binding transcriptional ArsR family regulator
MATRIILSHMTRETLADVTKLPDGTVIPHELTHPAVEVLQLPTVLAALAEPARLSILHTVADFGESSCTEIWERTGLGGSKSTMSHHFKTLREAGVVNMRWIGARKYVSIRRADLDARWPGLLDAVLGDQS